MRICVVGKKGVGKTRFCAALLGKKYINKQTVDFHEHQLNNCILIDTPSADKLSVIKPDKCLIILDGSRPLSSADLDIIDKVRKQNIKFDLCVCFGVEHYKEFSSDLPRNVNVFFATNKKEIKQFIAAYFKIFNLIEDNQKNTSDNKAIEYEIEDQIEEPNEEQAIKEKLKWIIVGKENAGKSTLMNKILGYNRVLVSHIPGTTQASVEVCAQYKDEELHLKDTAGVKSRNLEYVKNLLEKKSLVIFVIDGTKDLTYSDKYLLGQIMDAGLACVIALNKMDHEDFSDYMNFKLKRMFRFLPIINISAEKGHNVNKLLEKAKEVEQKITTRITTSKFNKWIEKEKHKFHGTKIKFACHIRLSPYEVAFFVSPMNKSKHVIAHLRNLFQEYFQLEGVCVKVLMRAARSSERASQVPLQYKKRNLKKD